MSRPEYSPMKQAAAGDKLYIWLFTYALVVMLFSGILTGRLVQETRDENKELEKRIEALEDRFDRLDLPVVRRDTVVFTDILTECQR